MGDPFKAIGNLLYKVGFLNSVNANNCVGQFSFGPLALLLAANIRNEWFQNNVIHRDMNMFLYHSHLNRAWQEDCKFSYSQALQFSNGNLPFGLVSVMDIEKMSSNSVKDDSHSMGSPQTSAYRCLVFIDEKESQQYFYRLQRQRKFWWRKFSTERERFNIEEKDNEGKETIQMTAKFPWRTEIVETIHNHGSAPLADYRSLFEIKLGRKKILPHVIESVSFEHPAVLTYLFDAFQQLPNRTILCLHHNLAPYKIAVTVDLVDEKVDEINQLAKYLTLSLRKAGLHALFSKSNKSKQDLLSQFAANDLVGIPYTIVVSAEALNNGIVSMRSRDTTLQEQLHVSQLTSYLHRLLTTP